MLFTLTEINSFKLSQLPEKYLEKAVKVLALFLL